MTNRVEPRCHAPRRKAWRRPLNLVGAAGLIGLAVLALPAGSSSAQGSDGTGGGSVSFDAASSAEAANLSMNIPGFPVSSTAVDGGGPTAQATLSSLGTSQGYAAFPDPGSLVVSLPGLVAGLAASGAVGLPPVKLPTLPPYPFDVSSDSNHAPSVSIGSGPYNISATSSSTSTQSSATAGLELDAVGNVALIRSTASAVQDSDGSVVASATSDMQGLTVGPLTIGELTTTATETLDQYGDLTPTSSMSISGLSIGGLGVALTGPGFDVLGGIYSLPINSTLDKLLNAAHITVSVVQEQTFGSTVVSPALQISGPVKIPSPLATGTSTYTLTIGDTSATLTSQTAPGADVSSGDVGGSGVTPDGSASLGSSSSPSTFSSGTGSFAGTSGSIGQIGSSTAGISAEGTQGSQPNRSPSAAAVTREPQSERVAFENFDIRSIFLVLALSAILVWAAGLLVRVIGVRTPWTSFDG